MELKVSPQQVEQFARSLHQWSDQLRTLNGQVKGQTEQLNRHWDDPQFRAFAEIIKGHALQVDASVKSFDELSSTLQKMARSMEENIKLQRQMLDELNRRR